MDVQLAVMLEGKLPVRAFENTLNVVISHHTAMLLGSVPCILLAAK
jgi:hypothetical protein